MKMMAVVWQRFGSSGSRAKGNQIGQRSGEVPLTLEVNTISKEGKVDSVDAAVDLQ